MNVLHTSVLMTWPLILQARKTQHFRGTRVVHPGKPPAEFLRLFSIPTLLWTRGHFPIVLSGLIKPGEFKHKSEIFCDFSVWHGDHATGAISVYDHFMSHAVWKLKEHASSVCYALGLWMLWSFWAVNSNFQHEYDQILNWRMSSPTKHPDSNLKSIIQRDYLNLCMGALSANIWLSVTGLGGSHGNYITRVNGLASSVATTGQEIQFKASAEGWRSYGNDCGFTALYSRGR